MLNNRSRTQDVSFYNSIPCPKKCEDSTIKIYIDNKSALKYMARARSTTSAVLQDLAIQSQELCNQHKSKVVYQHIPGAFNTQAAHLSRIKILLYGTSITKKTFQAIQQQLEKLKIDTFSKTQSATPKILVNDNRSNSSSSG